MTDTPGFVNVDVTELDVTDPSDLVTIGLQRAAELIPEWVPREGNVEVVLLEQMAVLIALLIERLETVVPAVTSQILELSGLDRDAGEAAALAVEFAMSDDLGHVIPAGSAVVIGDPNADEPITGTVTDAVTVPLGDVTGAGVVTLDSLAVVADLSTATEVLLIDAVPYVDEVTVTAVTSGGRDPETDDAFLGRGSAWLAAMTQLLGRPDQFAARALTDIRVGRALAVNRWDGVGTAGDVAGAVCVLLLGSDGAAMDPGDEDEVKADLEARAVTELTVAVQAPVVTPVAVTATITLLPGFVETAVVDAAEAAVAAWLDPLAWEWGEAVRLSRLTQVLETVSGVDSATIAAPAADVEIDPYELVEPGTITVSV